MKAVVEWGHPKAATARKICGVHGEQVIVNPTQASELARKLFHTLVEGKESGRYSQSDFLPSKHTPRKVIWAQDNSAWVAVSLLDGVDRGAYAGNAERDYQARVKAAAQQEGAVK
jgi:beta-glucosidase/6-phospho-beta-glucosidase/beta-galactosidase